MAYQKTVEITGNPAKALETVRDVLIQKSFRIEPTGSRSFEATGPGMTQMGGKTSDPLLAASRVTVMVGGRSLTLDAQFGGIRRMVRFLVVFLLALAGFMAILMGMLHRAGHLSGGMIWRSSILWSLAPWPLLIPLLVVVARRRAVKALDTMLHNASVVARD